MTRTVYLLLIVFACCIPMHAAEPWPQFRGPGGDGHAELRDPPVVWSGEENVVWKTPLPGEGWSSPVVVGQRIFLTAAVPIAGSSKDLSLQLLEVDGRTGKLARQIEVFQQEGDTAPAIHSKNSHASPTPVVQGDRIYVHFGHQGTASLDLDGELLWQNREMRYEPVHGNGGSPIVVGQALIFSADGRDAPFVVALDKENGRVLWKSPRRTDADKKFSFSTPTLIEVDGRKQVISPGSNVVCAFDPETGEELWRLRYDGYSVIPKPVYGHGLLFIATGYNRPSVIAIRPGGRGDVTETNLVWQTDRAAPHTPSLLLHEQYLYMVSDRGIASCLEARTGELKWQERLGGNFSASPLQADGKIYFLDEDGQTTVVAAGPEFRKLASNAIGERTLASLAVLEDDFLIRGQQHLFRIE